MRALLLIALTGVLFLVSCAPSDLPPEPGTPGVPVGQAFAYQAGYAPPADVYADEQVFFLSPPVVNSPLTDTTFDIDVDVAHPGGFIYKFGYYYTVAGWEAFEFTGDAVGNSNWIAESATWDPTLDKSDFSDGQNYVIAYSCEKYDGTWRCGCQSQGGTCGLWMLQNFLLRGVELPPEPPTPEELQTTFVYMSPSNRFVREGDGVFIDTTIQSSQFRNLNELPDTLNASLITGGETIVQKEIVLIDSPDTHLGFGRYLNEVRPSSITETDMPALLASGTIDEDLGNTKNLVTYTQEIDLFDNSGQLIFEQDDDNAPIAGPYLYFAGITDMYRYTLDFVSTVDYDTTSQITANDDLVGAKLDILGNTYHITDIKLKADNSIDRLTFFADAITRTLTQGNSVSFIFSGITYEFEVLDVPEENNCSISINGAYNSIKMGQTRSIGGVQIAVSGAVRSALTGLDTCDVILSDTEYEFEDGFEIKLNGFDIDGSEVSIISSPGALEEISYTYAPDDDIYVDEGESFTDPVFDAFSIDFRSVTTTERDTFELASAGAIASVKLPNNNGDKIELEWTVDSDNNIFLGRTEGKTYQEGETCQFTADINDCAGSTFLIVNALRTFNVLEIVSFDTANNNITLGDGTSQAEFDFNPTLLGTDQTIIIDGDDLGTIILTVTNGGLIFTDIDQSVLGPEIRTNAGIDIQSDGFTLIEEELDGYGGNHIRFPLVYDSTDNAINVSAPVILAGAWHAQNVDASATDSDNKAYLTNWTTVVLYDSLNQKSVQIEHPEDVRYGVVIVSAESTVTTTESIVESVELLKTGDVTCTQPGDVPFTCWAFYQGATMPSLGNYNVGFTSDIGQSNVQEGNFRVIPTSQFGQFLIESDIGTETYLRSFGTYSSQSEYYEADYADNFIEVGVTVDLTDDYAVIDKFLTYVSEETIDTKTGVYGFSVGTIDGQSVYQIIINEPEETIHAYAWISGDKIVTVVYEGDTNDFVNPIEVAREYLEKHTSEPIVETPRLPPTGDEFILSMVPGASNHMLDLANDIVDFAATKGVTLVTTTETTIDNVAELDNLFVVFINEDVNGDEHVLFIIGENSPASHSFLGVDILTNLTARSLEPSYPPLHATSVLNTEINTGDLSVVFPGVFCDDPDETTEDPNGYFTQSTVSKGGATSTDWCSSVDVLEEQSCSPFWNKDGGYNFRQETYTCPDGCATGACVSASDEVLLTVAAPSQGVTDLTALIDQFTVDEAAGFTFDSATNTNIDNIAVLDNLLVVFVNEDVNGDVHTLIIKGKDILASRSAFANNLAADMLTAGLPVTLVLNTEINTGDLSTVFPGTPCVDPDVTAEDPEGYFTQATTTLGASSSTDFCTGDILSEQTCNNTWNPNTGYAILEDTYVCPGGCSFGACTSAGP